MVTPADIATMVPWTGVLWGLVVLLFTKLLWEVLFSPLRAFPGPFLAKFSDGWRALKTLSGQVDTTHVQLHRQYGSAVRIGPGCISLGDPRLIRTVYATKGPWKKV
jgi:hypothetical protein